MSGWDVSSTPTWGSQDGPDETQSFAAAGDGSRDFGAQDISRPAPNSPAGGFPEAPGGFPGENQGQGGPPPEFYSSDYGQQDEHDVTPGGYPRRTPGRSLQDLPRRDRDGHGRHSSAQPGAYGQDDPFAQDSPSAFGQEPGFGQDSAFGQDSPAYGRDAAFSQDSPFGQDSAFGQDNSYGQDSAYGIGWGGSSAGQGQAPAQPGGWTGSAQPGDADWERGAGRSAAPWEERPQQDAGYPDLNGAGPGADYQREAPAGQDLGGRDFGGQEFGRQGFGQDFPGQEPGGPDYQAQNYPGQDYPGRERQPQGYGGQDYGDPRGPREPQGYGGQDGGTAAQMDPALQDFFAPQRGGTAGFQDPWADERPGSGPAGPRGRQGDDGWGEPGRQQPPRGGTGPRPAPRIDDDERGGLGTRGYIAIGAVVAVIIVVAVLVFTRGSGTPSPTAGSTPAATSPASSSQPASTASAAPASAGGAAAATAYTLSTPSKADGFPKGSDPNFLTTAKATAGQIAEAVTAGKAGTLKGSPLSAAYQLPVGGQVVTFVGYQGTFTPAKVATVLATLGTDAHSYSPGSHGGILGCANTAATATLTSGAVCVWSSGTTLGVTEFFSATGPESLTASQDKGAADTVAIRADVEAKS
jgi:hypothetical protein